MDKICNGCAYVKDGKCTQGHENSTSVIAFGFCGLKRLAGKTFIASYQNNKGECWDLHIRSESYKTGLKNARSHQKEYGKLFRFKLLWRN